MKECKKYIFIKDTVSLIFQLDATTEEIQNFYFGVLRCLTVGNVYKEQPFQISCNEKKLVVDFLNSRYSFDEKINKLIHFFTSAEENKYIYFYPYDEVVDEMYDCMRESLNYYNRGCSHEEIVDSMNGYINELNILKEKLDEMSYVINCILPIQRVIKCIGGVRPY